MKNLTLFQQKALNKIQRKTAKKFPDEKTVAIGTASNSGEVVSFSHKVTPVYKTKDVVVLTDNHIFYGIYEKEFVGVGRVGLFLPILPAVFGIITLVTALVHSGNIIQFGPDAGIVSIVLLGAFYSFFAFNDNFMKNMRIMINPVSVRNIRDIKEIDPIKLIVRYNAFVAPVNMVLVENGDAIINYLKDKNVPIAKAEEKPQL